VRRYRLTPRATQDLDDIAAYTQEKWGAAQMATYLRALDIRFAWLAENPEFGRRRDDVGKGYRSFPEGQHLVFYLIVEEEVVIIGVPHKAMDVGGELG